MTWTYDLDELAGTPLYQVRYLVGDTDTDHQEIQDEEINFSITQTPSIYAAAADVARSIGARYTRRVDEAAGDTKKNYSQRAKAFIALAAQLSNYAAGRSGAFAYAGGISRTDKRQQEQNTDRVKPQFNLGLEDNRLPVGPAGNETQS